MTPSTRITVRGDSTTFLNLESALTNGGIATRYSGPVLRQRRAGAADSTLQWFVLFVLPEVVDAKVRLVVDRIVGDFKNRNPNLRIAVDD